MIPRTLSRSPSRTSDSLPGSTWTTVLDTVLMLVNLSTSSAAIGQIMNVRHILMGTDEEEEDEEEEDDDEGVAGAGGGAGGIDEDGKVEQCDFMCVIVCLLVLSRLRMDPLTNTPCLIFRFVCSSLSRT
jgi:hypothetical protein